MARMKLAASRAESRAAADHVPEIIVFEHDDFNTHDGDEDGWAFRTNLAVSYIGDDWNDNASSVIVVSGTWRLFVDIDFGGGSIDLGPGYYGSLQAAGLGNDVLTSFEPIAY